MLTVILVVFIAVLYGLHYWFFLSRDGKLFSLVPGPKRLPLIGNALDLILDPVSLFYMGRRLANQYRSLYGVQVCGLRVLNLYDPREIEVILSNQKYNTKSRVYEFIKPWLKEGLLTSSGEKWQKRRKILTPAFHFNILRQFCTIFSEQSDKIVQVLNKEVGKPETDVVSFVTEFTINSICETAMGIQMDSSSNSDCNRYKAAIYEMGQLLVYRFVRLWFHISAIYNLSPAGRKQKKVLPALQKFTLNVIRERRKAAQLKGNVNIANEIENDDYMKSSKRRLAMLDLLLSAESEGNIDELGIREEVDTFMFEGHDTTTMGISFCLMLLANNKSVQEKIVAELDDIFDNSMRPATMEDLNNMKYLEWCLKESLRLYPSVPFISRAINEDTQMTNYLIPAGATCHIHIYDLHRDPNIFPDPLRFIPERFTPENCAKRHPFAYIPFSAGPRNCIGQRFALYELKSIVSTILRNFTLAPITKPEDIIFSADIVLRSKDPIKIKILPKNSINCDI